MPSMKLAFAALLALPLLAQAAEAPLDPIAEETVAVSKPYVSPLNYGLDLKYRPVRFPRVSAAQGKGGQIAFEWMPVILYKHFVGKPAVGMSIGYGQIPNLGTTPGGKTSLSTMPVSVHLAYRLDLIDNQILVPFGKIARAVTFEKYNPGTSTRFESWDYSLGAEICLNGLDSRSARHLDDSTGINNTYLIVEWMKSSGIDGRVQDDLSREEWQIGLRFEM
jgi:hypothetical protein